MRRIRYSVAMSLDGYIAGPKGEFDWIKTDPDFDFSAVFKQFDTILAGRGTFEPMAAAGRTSDAWHEDNRRVENPAAGRSPGRCSRTWDRGLDGSEGEPWKGHLVIRRREAFPQPRRGGNGGYGGGFRHTDSPGRRRPPRPESVKVDQPFPRESQGLFVGSCFAGIRHSPDRSPLTA